MCQCMICDCWWWNFCGTCAGVGEFFCCLGFWCCTPDTFPPEGKNCCICCTKSGLGSNCLCYGGVCCAPDWLVGWSKSQK